MYVKYIKPLDVNFSKYISKYSIKISLFLFLIVLSSGCEHSEKDLEKIPAVPMQEEKIEVKNINNNKNVEPEILFPEDSLDLMEADSLSIDTSKTATQPDLEENLKKKPSFKSFYRYLKNNKKPPVALIRKEEFIDRSQIS